MYVAGSWCLFQGLAVCKLQFLYTVSVETENRGVPALIVYLHVETSPLRCKLILRHGGGWKLVWLHLVWFHPQRRALCHVHKHNGENTLSVSEKLMMCSPDLNRHLMTYSWAPCRHVVCSWPAPLPPSVSALSLSEVRKTVLIQNELHCLGWIFSRSLFLCPEMIWELAIIFARYLPKSPGGPGELGCAEVQVCSNQTQIILTGRVYYWRRNSSLTIIIHILTHWTLLPIVWLSEVLLTVGM